MKEYKINVDVFCRKREAGAPSYRIYVDGDLITERSYIWENAMLPDNPVGQYVKENIWVNLAAGEHEVTIVPVDPSFRGFYITNVMLDDQPAQITSAIAKGRFIIGE